MSEKHNGLWFDLRSRSGPPARSLNICLGRKGIHRTGRCVVDSQNPRPSRVNSTGVFGKRWDVHPRSSLVADVPLRAIKTSSSHGTTVQMLVNCPESLNEGVTHNFLNRCSVISIALFSCWNRVSENPEAFQLYCYLHNPCTCP